MDGGNGSDSELETHKKKSKPKKDKHASRSKDPSVKKDAGRTGGFTTNVDTHPSLWELALQATEQSQMDASQIDEKSILFVGSKDGGKTTIILRFLDRDEPPKPTTALEYTFGRRPRGNNLDKDIAHIWELGGGTWLSRLSDIVINPEIVRNLSIAIVVDLSKPAELWLTLDRWLEVIRSRVKTVVPEVKDAEGPLKDKLLKEAWQRIGEDHVDREMIDPMLIPVVIIGSKYDIFQDFDPETRKVISRTLRFIAHRNGAHLQFFTTKTDALMSKMRSVISHLVFSTSLGKTCQVDNSKPVIVTAGQDTFQSIGSPPLPEGDIGRVTAKTPTDLWRHAFNTKFPQQNTADPSLVDDPAKDKQFAESAIDAMRAQKDEELERYRRASERKAKETINKSLTDGFVY